MLFYVGPSDRSGAATGNPEVLGGIPGLHGGQEMPDITPLIRGTEQLVPAYEAEVPGDIETIDCGEKEPVLDRAAITADIEEIYSEIDRASASGETGVDQAAAGDWIDAIEPTVKAVVRQEPRKKRNLVSRIRDEVRLFRDTPSLEAGHATAEDIDDLVDVDLRSFDSVYTGYEQSSEELREELREKFKHRFELLGSKWMPVVRREGKIVGFMTCCPTDHKPDSFETWEKMTDNGTLNSTYSKDGKNAYIVTLSMLPEGSKTQGQNMMFADQIATMIKEDLNLAFFESRLPGFRRWATVQARKQGLTVDDFDDATKQRLAEKYFSLKKQTPNGKRTPYDHLISLYVAAGCKPERLIPNAYKDDPSMDFGVLFTFENPLPSWVRKSKLARSAVGGALSAASKSAWLMRKFFKE